MFKIGDFSRVAQISVRMLRHYDKLGLLTPSHTDRFTGYRYYTIDQLPRLNRIVALNDLGLTLEQIGGLLGKDAALPVEQLRGMLMLRRAEVEQELAAKQWQMHSIEARLRQIEQENDPDPYEIVVKSVPAVAVVSLRQMSPSVHEVGYFCATLYGQIYRRLEQLGMAPLEPEITLYHNEEYQEQDIDMEAAVPVAPEIMASAVPVRADHLRFHELPALELAASLIYEGDFTEITTAIFSLLRWVGEHRHLVAGPLRELHLSGQAHPRGANSGRHLIELQAPIIKMGA